MSAHVSDKQALRSLLGCLAAVAAVVAIVAAITVFGGWPAVGEVAYYVLHVVFRIVLSAVSTLLNILAAVAVPVLGLALISLLLSACLLGKGFGYVPGEGAAPWRGWISERLEVLFLVSALVLSVFGITVLFPLPHDSAAALRDYATVVSTPRADLESVDIADYTVWRSLMVEYGFVERSPARSTCQKLLAATPDNSPYLLTINGRAAGQAGCGWGPNHLVWRER